VRFLEGFVKKFTALWVKNIISAALPVALFLSKGKLK